VDSPKHSLKALLYALAGALTKRTTSRKISVAFAVPSIFSTGCMNHTDDRALMSTYADLFSLFFCRELKHAAKVIRCHRMMPHTIKNVEFAQVAERRQFRAPRRAGYSITLLDQQGGEHTAVLAGNAGIRGALFGYYGNRPCKPSELSYFSLHPRQQIRSNDARDRPAGLVRRPFRRLRSVQNPW
jgi:hypothetical protein